MNKLSKCLIYSTSLGLLILIIIVGIFGFINAFPIKIFNEKEQCTINEIKHYPKQYVIPINEEICVLKTSKNETKYFYNKGYLILGCLFKHKLGKNFTCYCEKDFCFDAQIPFEKVQMFVICTFFLVCGCIFLCVWLIFFIACIKIKSMKIRNYNKLKDLNQDLDNSDMEMDFV